MNWTVTDTLIVIVILMVYDFGKWLFLRGLARTVDDVNRRASERERLERERGIREVKDLFASSDEDLRRKAKGR